MNKLLATAALGLALSLSSAPVFADQQRTGDESDDALNWAAVGGRHSMVGAYAQFGTKPIKHRFGTRAYDSVYPPVGPVGGGFVYGAGRAPYASDGGSALDFQLQGR